MATFTACLVIIAVWLFFGAAVIGLGRGARRLLGGPLDGWSLGDFWTGLAVVVTLLMAGHVAFAVRTWWWFLLGPLALAGLLLRPRPRIARKATTAVFVVVALILVLYVADRAQLGVGSYDSGLYHLPYIDWVHAYRAVPGLANFHGRFGFNTGSLMFDALIGTVVPTSIAAHFGNSLLMMVALLELVLVFPRLWHKGLTAAEYAPGIILIAATPALILPLHNSWDISSPSPDLPAVVVTLMTAVYLARLVSSREPRPALVVPTVALLALMPVIRVQLVAFTVVAGVGLLVALATRQIQLERPRVLLPRLTGLAVVVLGAWALHGVVLSGYPAFPLRQFGLPVSWKVPTGWAKTETDIITAWAREPRVAPAQVLSSSAWLKPWAGRVVLDPQVRGILLLAGVGNIGLVVLALHQLIGGRAGSVRRATATVLSLLLALVAVDRLVHYVRRAEAHPLTLLRVSAIATLIGILALGALALQRSLRDRQRLAWSAPTAVVGLAGAASCVAWYVAAPDPRFATGVLWLTAGIPAAAALSWLWPRRRTAAAVALLALVAASAAYPVRAVHQQHMLAIDHAPSVGTTWGLSRSPVVPTTRVPAGADGTVVNAPVGGGDQCWAGVLPCTPYPQKPWRLRDPGNFGGGFVMTRDFDPARDPQTP